MFWSPCEPPVNPYALLTPQYAGFLVIAHLDSAPTPLRHCVWRFIAASCFRLFMSPAGLLLVYWAASFCNENSADCVYGGAALPPSHAPKSTISSGPEGGRSHNLHQVRDAGQMGLRL